MTALDRLVVVWTVAFALEVLVLLFWSSDAKER